MDPTTFWLFLSIAFLAQIFGTVAGFGAATVLTPFAALFLDIKSAIALVAFSHLLGNISRIILFRKNIDWVLFTQFGLASVLFTITGAWLAGKMPSYLLTAVFGGFLILYVIFSFSFPNITLPGKKATALWGGVSSGFVSGLIGTGGAIRSAFLMAFNLPKEIYIGTSSMIAAVIDSIRLPIYIAQGFLSKEQWPLLIGLIFVSFSGAAVGKKAVSYIPQSAFKKFVLIILLLMGAKMLWDGLV